MAKEESQPGREPASQAGARPLSEKSERHAEDSLAYDVLARRYQGALLRICHLEDHIKEIAKRLLESLPHGGTSHEQAHQGRANDVTSLVARIEALETDVAGSSERMHQPGGANDTREPSNEDSPSPSQRDDEVAQLRFQVASLGSQLAHAEEQLNEVKRTRVRRRSSRRHRSKWKFWRRWMGR